MFDDGKDGGARDATTKIPSFGHYFSGRGKGGETNNKVFQYFMVGTMGALSAAGAKATVQGGCDNMKAGCMRF